MKLCLITLIAFLVCRGAWAEEDYSSMKKFIQQEDERLKDIKILSLDVEKTELEFKKKEILAKMSGLNQGHEQERSNSLSKPLDNVLDVHLAGVLINGNDKLAFINFNGKVLTVREGEEFGDQIKALEITSEQVCLQYPDGKKQILKVSRS